MITEKKTYRRHTELYKLRVVNFFYTHGNDRKLTLNTFDIDHSCLRDWLKKFPDPEQVKERIEQKERENEAEKLHKLPENRIEAESAFELLQHELEELRRRNKALDLLIDCKDVELRVSIRKKE